MFNPRVLDFRFQLSQSFCALFVVVATGRQLRSMFSILFLGLVITELLHRIRFYGHLLRQRVYQGTLQRKSTRVVMGCANAPERAKFISCVRINTLIGAIKARSLRNRLFHLFLVF